MELYFQIALAVVLSAVLSVVFYRLRCLTPGGAIASFAVGSFVGAFGTINAFFLLTLFTVVGFVATLRGISSKKAQWLQEGIDGERGWKNVLGVGVPPCLFVAIWAFGLIDDTVFAIAFVSTIAVAGADTIASEIGVRDKKVYMITNMERVEPGVNGGVSVIGTVTSTIAALAIAVIGWVALTGEFDLLMLIPFVAGVIGNLLDSVFGSVLENPGYISKFTNNGSTAIIGALIGVGLYFLI